MTRTTLAVLLALGVLTGCQTVQENAGACQKPPALRDDPIAKAPVAEYVQSWQPGYWDWSQGGYIWTEGRWIKNAGQGNQWMAGYWDRPVTPGPCVWVPAHWM